MSEPLEAPAHRSPLQDLIREGSFGPFYWNDFEFLRRILVSVRDRHWWEIAPSRWDCSVDETRRTIHVSARHLSDDIDFEWTGQLHWDAAGCELRFELEGQALRSMEINRVGLVILHPAAMLTGSTLTTRGSSSAVTARVRGEIAPQPIIAGVPQAMTDPFDALMIEHFRWGQLELELGGDEFELEDQRNWGDDSFKTYCTPLRLGFPRAVEKGFTVSHQVRVRFFPGPDVRYRPAPVDLQTETVVRIRPFRIGRIAATAEEAAADPNWMLGWDHIRIDLDAAGEGPLRELLPRLPHGATVHVVTAVEDSLSPARIQLLSALANRTSAVLIRARNRGLPTAQAIAHVRAALKGTAANRIPLLAIPNGHFVEFNRGEPFELDVDGIAFPLSPTVHGEDAATILENAQVVRAMIETARRLTGKAHIALSPLALSVSSAGKRPAVSQSVATAWLAQVLTQSQAAGIAAVTLGSDLL